LATLTFSAPFEGGVLVLLCRCDGGARKKGRNARGFEDTVSCADSCNFFVMFPDVGEFLPLAHIIKNAKMNL